MDSEKDELSLESCSGSSDSQSTQDTTPGCYVKKRHIVTLMAFFAKFNLFSMRSNLSVAIVAMVNQTTQSTAQQYNNSDVCSDYDTVPQSAADVPVGTFEWTAQQQGLALGCYMYGYVLSNVPSGYLAEKYGIKLVMGITMLLSSILTVVTPLAASSSFELFIASRILLGILQGPVSPSVQAAYGNWAPPLEVTRMIALASTGNSLGTLITMPLAAVVAKTFGWQWVFYVTGAIAFPFSLLWLVLIYDSPTTHPGISQQEREYILKSKKQDTKEESEKIATPWLAIMTSGPLWAITFAQLANNWGASLLLFMLPTYLSSILRLNLSMSGILSALPYILQFFLMLFMGYLSDALRLRKIFTTLTVRKINSFACLCLTGIFALVAGYSGCNIAAAVVFLSLSLAFTGCNSTAHEANVVDIAPRLSGLCFGIVNTISAVSGFLAPQVSGWILESGQSLAQWRTIFWIVAIVDAVGFILFLLFSSSEEQPWSRPDYLKDDVKRFSDNDEETLKLSNEASSERESDYANV